MDEIYWGRIVCDSFHYRLPDNTINRIVTKQIIGQVECIPHLLASPSSYVLCQIENGQLYATQLIVSIREDDLKRIPQKGYTPTAQEKIVGYRPSGPIDLIELTYELSKMPISYTGTLALNQIFVDEARYPNGVAHKDVSTFVFKKGVLDTGRSNILQSQTTTFVDSGRIWNDDIPKQLSEQSEQYIDHRRRYYVNPVGNLRQNEYIIDVVCWYKSSMRISESVLEQLFSHDVPVLRTHLKIETAPGSCVFKDRVYDLVAEATKMGDKVLLDKLIHYGTPQEDLQNKQTNIV